ncbi:MAG: SUV3 C-terminal domain-containing protein [Campylobacterota bacterium]|nr:SUV3 C-terminal domain-containing protein [Campylobacterota bacterium]
MSKKNKKNSKINQRIKKFFDGDPFDIGVERVSGETLSEMFHTLGIHEVEYAKDELVKLARMLWSEADTGFRQDVLNFFTNDDKIYQSNKPKDIVEPSIDKEEKLNVLLEELDITDEEALELRSNFLDMRARKITISKMETKLKHIRYEAKREKIQKACEGFFDIDDSFEFNASIHYILYGESFYKIEVLKTLPYDYDFLDSASQEEIVKKILSDKEKVTKNRQIYIERFIQTIKNPHEFLTQKEVVSSLRSSPPQSSKYPQIREDILESIISTQLDVKNTQLFKDEYFVQMDSSVDIPFSKEKVNYLLDLHIELESLLGDIWAGENLDFSQIVYDAKVENEKQFLLDLNELVASCNSYASLLHLEPEDLYTRVSKYLKELLGLELHITPKIKKKTIRRFIYNIQDEIVKKQRQALLGRTIRDFKNLFPQARGMRRKLTLHIGPTNSGKTYQAMKKLADADTGYYLAPLRLLALEGYENLNAKGIDASLITGEEQIMNEDATHISSTIEMLNFEVDVDVCVIDEVQMIGDSDRGWAWANAIIGTPASEIIMTGSPNSKDAIIALAEYLGEELEIIEFERKNPLELLENYTDAKDVTDGTAIIAFSRKDVLRLKQQFSKDFSVSVVYGNLSPEVRREEARRFRDGKTQILVATDAIAMGLNLPIKTILFSKADKFDGVSQRDLTPSEIAQISGRAGRYGLEEKGFVGALDRNTLKVIKRNFNKEMKAITIPFKVMANLEHIKLVANILEESSLEEILKFFGDNMEFNGPFHASNLDDMLEASKIVDTYDLDIATKFHLSCAPLTLKSPYIIDAYNRYIYALEKKLPVIYNPPKLDGSFAKTSMELLRAEDMVKEISLYLWLSYRFNDYFLDEQKARTTRGNLNKYIENSLQQASFVKTCRMCEAPLPKNSKYNICQKCFKKNYTGGGYRGKTS